MLLGKKEKKARTDVPVSKKGAPNSITKKLKEDEELTGIKFELQALSSTDYIEGVKLIDKYEVGKATVSIVEDSDGRGFYLIDEPSMNEDERIFYERIMQQMFLTAIPSRQPTDDVLEHVKRQIIFASDSIGVGSEARKILDKLVYYIGRDMLNYGIIGVLMNDPEIEDIMAENHNVSVGVVHRRHSEYGILDTNIIFRDPQRMNSFVQKLVQRASKTITAAVPFVDAISEEGHRISATFGREISLPGPNFTIRKFSYDPFTITTLINFNTLDPLIAAYIWTLMESKAFVLVIGPTSAGKTTTIGAILSMIHPGYKLTTIEDTPELRVPHEHWQRLITRRGYSIFESKYEIDMDSLVKIALRSRPDHIIVGEVRGAEASSLVQAVATGHGGVTSFHATDPRSALVRLGSPPLNVQLSGQMLISCFVRQNRVTRDGKSVRRILDIVEVIPRENSIDLIKVFEWDPVTDSFEPKDVDSLLKSSYRLNEIMNLQGYTEEQMKEDLTRRREFLENLVERKIERFDQVSKEFSGFYLQSSRRKR